MLETHEKSVATKTDVFIALRNQIDAGEFEVGERLPAERHLSHQFGVARGTLREGLKELEAAGYVERRQGSGTYVVFRKNRDAGRVDGAFHLALAEIAGNRLLSWMTRLVSEARTQQGWSQVLTLTLNPEQIRTYNIQHRAIVNAIRKRDPDTATRIMRQHISAARDSLHSIASA